MDEQRFETVIAAEGERAYITLPFNPNATWKARGRHHVTGSVNGIDIRGELQVVDGAYRLMLGPAWRRDSGLAVGDCVDVVLAPEGPLTTNVASDIAEALAGEPRAAAFFDDLPTFYRNNYARWIDDAKRPATRAARIAEMVALLKVGRRER